MADYNNYKNPGLTKTRYKAMAMAYTIKKIPLVKKLRLKSTMIIQIKPPLERKIPNVKSYGSSPIAPSG